MSEPRGGTIAEVLPDGIGEERSRFVDERTRDLETLDEGSSSDLGRMRSASGPLARCSGAG